MIQEIGKYKDNLLNVEYTLAMSNAAELSTYLKQTIDGDINYFDRDKKVDKPYYSDFEKIEYSLIETPPTEIYEYQPFFLLKNKDGRYILFDGYRRLIKYQALDYPIQVRIYEEEILTEEMKLKLLIYLNHFKFYGGSGQYFDRGFAMAFHILFDIDVMLIYKELDGYLAYLKSVMDYTTNDTRTTVKNLAVKDRILNPMFLSDMRFIQKLKQAGVFTNSNIGCFIYEQRLENNTIEFNSKLFIDEYNKNKNIQTSIKKYNRGGSYAIEGNNEILQEYKNVFAIILGGEVKLSYNDFLLKAKELSTNLKKDKNYVKINGSDLDYKYEDMILEYYKSNNKSPIFKVVVYPNKNKHDISAVGVFDAEMIKYDTRGIIKKQIPYIVLSEHKQYKITTTTLNNFSQVVFYKEMHLMGNNSTDDTFDGYRYKIDIFVSFV